MTDLKRPGTAQAPQPDEATRPRPQLVWSNDHRPQGRNEPSSLHEARLVAVLDALRHRGARRVADLGCGPGPLFQRLALDPSFERLVAVDLRLSDLEALHRRLAHDTERSRVQLVHGSFLDPTLNLGLLDAAVLLETIEHTDPDRLSKLETTVFRAFDPASVIITTPNAEYNPVYGLPPGRRRHWDHRFEWDRDRFATWCRGVALRQGFDVTLSGVGLASPMYGSPSQMAVFDRRRP